MQPANRADNAPYLERVQIGDATLYLGDCLEILPTLPKVDAVITDPPYGINTKSDGTGKLNPWADLTNAAFFYADWISKCKRLLCRKKPEGHGSLWTFLNWRSMVTFQKASCDMGWPIESLLVWDKQCIGTGGTRGLRPSYEMVALFCHGDWTVQNRGLADVQRWKWASAKPTGHPAEKPIEGLEWVVNNGSEHGDVVLDPFMGSGTTGVASIALGRKFIGIEMDRRWFDTSCERIAAAQSQGKLFE